MNSALSEGGDCRGLEVLRPRKRSWWAARALAVWAQFFVVEAHPGKLADKVTPRLWTSWVPGRWRMRVEPRRCGGRLYIPSMEDSTPANREGEASRFPTAE